MSKIGIKTLEQELAQTENSIYSYKCMLEDGYLMDLEEHEGLVKWKQEIKDLKEDIKKLRRK